MINLELLLQTLYFKKCDLNPSSCQTDRTESRDAIASKNLSSRLLMWVSQTIPQICFVLLNLIGCLPQFAILFIDGAHNSTIFWMQQLYFFHDVLFSNF